MIDNGIKNDADADFFATLDNFYRGFDMDSFNANSDGTLSTHIQ